MKTPLSALLDDCPRDAVTSNTYETQVRPGNGISTPMCQALRNHRAENTSKEYSEHFSAILPIFLFTIKAVLLS